LVRPIARTAVAVSVTAPAGVATLAVIVVSCCLLPKPDDTAGRRSRGIRHQPSDRGMRLPPVWDGNPDLDPVADI
jgi:hypothetical protein